MPIPLPPSGGVMAPLQQTYAYPIALMKGGDRLPNFGRLRGREDWDLVGGSSCAFSERFGMRCAALTDGVASGYLSKVRSSTSDYGRGEDGCGYIASTYFYMRDIAASRRRLFTIIRYNTAWSLFWESTTQLVFGTPAGSNTVSVTLPSTGADRLLHVMVSQVSENVGTSSDWLHMVALDVISRELWWASSTSTVGARGGGSVRFAVGGLTAFNTALTYTVHPNADVFSTVCDFRAQSLEWLQQRIHNPWWYLCKPVRIVKGAAAASAKSSPFLRRRTRTFQRSF